MSATMHPDTDRWLREHARRWVEAGLLSDEQAAEIVAAETHPEVTHAPVAAAEAGQQGEPQGLPLAAELLSYLGIILVAVSGAVVVARFWDDISVVGRVGVGLSIAALGLVGGWLVLRLHGASAERLGGFLWLGGTAGVALTAGVVEVEMADGKASAVTGLVVGLAVLALSVVLWRNLATRPLQFLTTVGGLSASVGFGVAAAEVEPSVVLVGVAIWIAAVTLGGLALRGIVRPEMVALVVAGVGAVESMMAVASEYRAVGLGLAVASAAGVVLVGLWRKYVPVVVVGVLTFLVSLGQLLGMYLRGVGSALVVLVLGVVAVAVAVRMQLRRRGVS
jgi:hypothetical protein